jgi:hypothetical protein
MKTYQTMMRLSPDTKDKLDKIHCYLNDQQKKQLLDDISQMDAVRFCINKVYQAITDKAGIDHK